MWQVTFGSAPSSAESYRRQSPSCAAGEEVAIAPASGVPLPASQKTKCPLPPHTQNLFPQKNHFLPTQTLAKQLQQKHEIAWEASLII